MAKNQEAYEQDMSGFEVVKSRSDLTSDSTVTSQVLSGGARSLVGTETTTDNYSSSTEEK
jgi:hypothetical protein